MNERTVVGTAPHVRLLGVRLPPFAMVIHAALRVELKSGWKFLFGRWTRACGLDGMFYMDFAIGRAKTSGKKQRNVLIFFSSPSKWKIGNDVSCLCLCVCVWSERGVKKQEKNKNKKHVSF